jgi:hypothetical protein
MTAMLSLLALAVMGGFLALVFNIGLVMDARTELQGAADSAALAAAGFLDGSQSGLDRARTAAAQYSQLHVSYGSRITINGSDVTPMVWDSFSSSFVDATSDPWYPFSAIAVNVANGRDSVAGHPRPIPIHFKEFLGGSDAEIHSSATAMGPGARVRCALPFALALCQVVDTVTKEPICDPPMTTNPDSFGLANLRNPSTTLSTAAGTLRDTITDDYCTAQPTRPFSYESPLSLRRADNNDFDMQTLAALMGYSVDPVTGDWHYNGGGKCRLNVSLSVPVVRIETCGTINTSNDLDSPQAVVRYAQVFIEQIVIGGQNYIDGGNLLGWSCPTQATIPYSSIATPSNPMGDVVRMYGPGTCPNGNSTCIKTHTDCRTTGGLSYGGPIINVAQ